MGKTTMEIERRFIVRSIDSSVLDKADEIKEIKQYYFETPPAFSKRVRIIDDKIAFVSHKRGEGISREEFEKEIDLEPAKILIEDCTEFVVKTRYVFYDQDGSEKCWEIDLFHEPLEGLIIAERELDSTDEEIEFPKWLNIEREVTDSLSSWHLARAAKDLLTVDEILAATVPKIVLTGPPCSGKSTILDMLKADGRFHCVSEVASIVISHVNVPPNPNNASHHQKFNRTLSRIQEDFEDLSAIHCRNEGKGAMILDRGSLDNAAYLEDGLNEFEKLTQSTVPHEYERYAAVICLGLPPKDVYSEKMLNNPARKESFEEAEALQEKILTVWCKHPNFNFVNDDSWDEKVQNVMDTIEGFIS